MKTSEKLNLSLPEPSDFVDVNVLTEDLKKIDDALPGTNKKETPVAEDGVLLYDSADSGKPKKTLLSALSTLFALAAHKHTKSDITDFPTSMTPTAHTHTASEITSGTLPVVRGGTGAADASTARSNLGAGAAPALLTATFPASGWVLSGGCYQQTVYCGGLTTADGPKTALILPQGSTDAAAQLLTDAAYGAIFAPGGYAACNTANYLYARGPSGGSAPTANFTVNVQVRR